MLIYKKTKKSCYEMFKKTAFISYDDIEYYDSKNVIYHMIDGGWPVPTIRKSMVKFLRNTLFEHKNIPLNHYPRMHFED